MNWLDRIRPLLLMSLVAGIFFSCESEDNTFDFELENRTQVQLLELPLTSRSVFVDSLRTDNENTVVAGNYQDPNFGSIEANAYFVTTYTEGKFPTDTLTFDSLELRLNVANIVTNSVDSIADLYLYTFREDLISSVVYLKDKEHPNGVLTDSVSIQVESLNDNIRVKADHLGARIFNQMIGQAEDILLNGYSFNLAMVPKAGNQSAMTFNLRSDSSQLVFYSHYDTLNFTTIFSFNGRLFSSIKNDISGSLLDGVVEREPFELPDAKNRINSIFGVYTYIDLTPFKEFTEANENVIFNRALITTEFNGSMRQPVYGLRYYFYKEGIGFSGEGVLTNPYYSVVLSNQSYYSATQEVLISPLDEDEGYYETDVTFFIESYYNNYKYQEEYLTNGLIATPNNFVTFQESEVGETKIKLYYTVVQ